MTLTFDDTQAAALLDALGLPADTTDIEVVITTAADLADQCAKMDPAQPSTVAAAAKRAGLEVVDGPTLAALRHDATEGRKIAAAAAQQRIEASVDDAIGKGKITPARRKHWISLIQADPGMADVLASVPNETAAPMTELGHGVEAQGDDDSPKWFYGT